MSPTRDWQRTLNEQDARVVAEHETAQSRVVAEAPAPIDFGRAVRDYSLDVLDPASCLPVINDLTFRLVDQARRNPTREEYRAINAAVLAEFERRRDAAAQVAAVRLGAA